MNNLLKDKNHRVLMQLNSKFKKKLKKAEDVQNRQHKTKIQGKRVPNRISLIAISHIVKTKKKKKEQIIDRKMRRF